MATRRDCLRGGAGAAAALAMAGCSQLTQRLSQPAVPQPWAGDEAELRGSRGADRALLRTLHRAGFGPRPGDVERVREIGLDAYLEEQLHPERLEESPAIAWRLWKLDTLQADTDFCFE